MTDGEIQKTIKPGPLEPEGEPTAGIGFFNALRRIEARAEGKPRIGQNTSLRQEVVTIGQDPFMAFPLNDLQRVFNGKGGRPELRNHVIGFYGAHGPLPLDITEEVYRWTRDRDWAFVRFTDIFATRFQQSFYRAWADARAITQFDHPDHDRFAGYVGALLGIGTPAFQHRDESEDLNKLFLAPLAMGRVKSPRKLQQMLHCDLEVEVAVEEHVPVWIAFEEDNRNALGAIGSTLGQDTYLGARVQSVEEKLVLHIHTRSFAQYRDFLPGGASHKRLRDIVAWYLGEAYEVDVSLSLPAGEARLAKLGETVELGWMALLEPDDPPPPDARMKAASYALSKVA